ncbi:MAG: polysaccharide deacetylase [Lachnospiraceae bacterium]|nr:polysaccharide deacetylase [Lachnospiraceae bacterium]
MLKRRLIRGGTLVAALLLANLAVFGTAKKEIRQAQNGEIQAENLLENVLAENMTADGSQKKKENNGREEDIVSKTEHYPYLYATGSIEEKKLPEKVAFLTFDDGPSKNTIKILDTLAEYNACATFFVIGENLTESGIEIAKRALEEGHMLGMHTETHRYEKIYRSVEAFLTDYDKLASRFVEAFGECPAAFRFPGGSYSVYINPIKKELREELERRGFMGYDWNVSGEDAVGTPTAYSIKKNIFDSVYKQEQPIILLHDSPCSDLTAEVLPEILKKLTDEGYTFMTLQYRKPYQFPW